MNSNLSSRLYYPDPFKPTGIKFTLEEAGIVTLKILDSSGREAETLIDNIQYPPGEHIVLLDLLKYSSGEYLYRIIVQIRDRNITETKRII
jgi:hypothetical protein